MQVNLHDAKTHLPRYIDQAPAGEEVVIARAGKSLVRVVPLTGARPPRRLGFLAGSARVDADRQRDLEDEINAMFDLGAEPVTEP